jgi:hypothetical protein
MGNFLMATGVSTTQHPVPTSYHHGWFTADPSLRINLDRILDLTYFLIPFYYGFGVGVA